MNIVQENKKRLVVMLGAGASHDCVNLRGGIVKVNESFRPPLINQLFNFNDPFNAILKKYPKAEALSANIRERIKFKNENLEDILREYFNESDFELKKQLLEIPLYLQELIGEVGEHYIASGGNYFDWLIRELHKSDYDEIMFITVNYDIFLEKAISKIVSGLQFNDIDSYINHQRISVIKLHGSINWGRFMIGWDEENSRAIDILSSLTTEPQLSDDYVLLDGHQEEARFQDGFFHFPAISVPILGKNDFQCPEQHYKRVVTYLPKCNDFLFIGFSGNDEHILNLFKVVQNVNKLKIVTRRKDSAKELNRILFKNNPAFHLGERAPAEGGFSHFINDGGLEEYLKINCK